MILQQTALAQLDTLPSYGEACAYQSKALTRLLLLSIKHAPRYRNTAPAPQRKPPEPEQNYILPHMRAAYEECLGGPDPVDQKLKRWGKVALAAAG